MTCRDKVDIMASHLKGRKKIRSKVSLVDNSGGSRKKTVVHF